MRDLLRHGKVKIRRKLSIREVMRVFWGFVVGFALGMMLGPVIIRL